MDGMGRIVPYLFGRWFDKLTTNGKGPHPNPLPEGEGTIRKERILNELAIYFGERALWRDLRGACVGR